MQYEENDVSVWIYWPEGAKNWEEAILNLLSKSNFGRF